MDATRAATAPGPVILVVVGLVCVVLGLSVVWRGAASETAAGFWPPSGAALVAMLVVPVRRWGWVVGGILFPTAIGFALAVMPVEAGVLWGVANCAEPALAALVLRRAAAARWATPARMLVVFVVVAAVLAPMVAGALGAVGTVRGYPDERWLDVWLEWVLGDGLGVVVVTPLLLDRRPTRVVRRTRRERAALAATVGTATGLAFLGLGANGAALLPYLMLVALVWAAMRFGARAAASAGFVVALGANVATSFDLGPFAAAERSVDAITLPIFLGIALVTSFVVASMASTLADRDEVQRLLEHQATHDALTGLPNRALLAEWLDDALGQGCAEGTSVAVLVLDLDDFERLNDRHGHATGDRALCSAAALLQRAVRPGDLLARLGGDDFVVVSRGIAGPADALDLAHELLTSLSQAVDLGTARHRLGASVGVALVDAGDPISGADLLHRADVALHHAERAPASRVALFDHALEARTRRRVELAEELRGSVDRGELAVAYQPVVALDSGEVTELEALVRWTNRRFGAVGPEEFVPVAEETGSIGRIGEWVLEEACRQLAAWRAEVPGLRTRVAVNVSARQLSDAGFPGRVRRTLAASGLPASALTLEITETAVMDDLDASDRVLAELRVLGVLLSMDDFGTGHSSMSNLRRTPLHVLKIDRSFIAGLGAAPRDTAIVASIIELGHSFDLEVVAEGVETAQQAEHLVRLGCDRGQGFLWSRPVDGASAGRLLRTRFAPPGGADHLHAAPALARSSR